MSYGNEKICLSLGSGDFDQMKKRLLIIFYRNPEPGKVKHRLAITVGEERALALYLLMAAHTRKVSQVIDVDKVVYYSEFLDSEDNWGNDQFIKRVQHGNNLGERMNQAFQDSFDMGYESVCIIGTDCLELTSEILIDAFEKLNVCDAVIGPAADGGYYLLGTNAYIPEVFKEKKWSTDTVFSETMQDLMRLNLNVQLLPVLHDIDTEANLPPYLR